MYQATDLMLHTENSSLDGKASARSFFVASIVCRVALPHPQSITNVRPGGPRVEFMLNEIETAHAISVVDLVVADWNWRALRKERVGIYSVTSASCQWRQVLRELTAASNWRIWKFIVSVYNPVCCRSLLCSTKHAKVRHAKACKRKTSAA